MLNMNLAPEKVLGVGVFNSSKFVSEYRLFISEGSILSIVPPLYDIDGDLFYPFNLHKLRN